MKKKQEITQFHVRKFPEDLRIELVIRAMRAKKTTPALVEEIIRDWLGRGTPVPEMTPPPDNMKPFQMPVFPRSLRDEFTGAAHRRGLTAYNALRLICRDWIGRTGNA
jgi:hypothetical protein